jgi:hypothetical protein
MSEESVGTLPHLQTPLRFLVSYKVQYSQNGTGPDRSIVWQANCSTRFGAAVEVTSWRPGHLRQPCAMRLATSEIVSYNINRYRPARACRSSDKLAYMWTLAGCAAACTAKSSAFMSLRQNSPVLKRLPSRRSLTGVLKDDFQYTTYDVG